jgi:hypothetical protein
MQEPKLMNQVVYVKTYILSQGVPTNRGVKY